MLKRKDIDQPMMYMNWLDLPDYEPEPNEVHFHYCEFFNLLNRNQIRRDWNIADVFEVVEVFREPRHDMDGSFKHEQFLVARFDDPNAAFHFKLRVPPRGT
jgi:hypothetical protein